MTDSNDTSRGRLGRKVRTLAIGALATAALALPAVSAVSVVGHDAFGHGSVHSTRISTDSHRLAVTLKPASVRLT